MAEFEIYDPTTDIYRPATQLDIDILQLYTNSWCEVVDIVTRMANSQQFWVEFDNIQRRLKEKIAKLENQSKRIPEIQGVTLSPLNNLLIISDGKTLEFKITHEALRALLQSAIANWVKK